MTDKKETNKQASVWALENLGHSPHIMMTAGLFIVLLLFSVFPSDITIVIMSAVVLGCIVLSFVLCFKPILVSEKDHWNFLPFLIGVCLLAVLLQSHEQLLVMLVAIYMLASLVFVGRMIRLQSAIIIVLAVTAIIFRVYPALPGVGDTPGHLISMDDPYYHYKYTELLYKTGDIPDRVYNIYPPEGKPAPHNYPYYHNTYLALVTGNSIHDITILYPVFMAAFGAVMLFFFLKELTGDWKSGFLGGLFFATMPSILSKSAAGAVEEDMMGLVLGIFSLYLLTKALKSTERKGLAFSILCGLSSLLTIMAWKGSAFIFSVSFSALALYLYIGGLFSRENWQESRAVLIIGAIAILGKLVLLDKFVLDYQFIAPFGLAVFAGFWAEAVKGSLNKTSKFFAFVGLLGLLVLILSLYAIDLSGAPGLTATLIIAGAWLMIVGALVSLLLVGSKKGFVIGDISLSNLNKTLKGNLMPICSLLLVLGIIFMLFYGDKVATAAENAFGGLAGTTIGNFLVDKTISEQARAASEELSEQLSQGYCRYNVSIVLTVIMGFLMAALLALTYFYLKDKDRTFELLRAYVIALLFALFAWKVVWGESRLIFSQSVSFILLGAMIGLLLPDTKKQLGSLRIIPFLILLFLVPYTIFAPQTISACGGRGDAWSAAHQGSSVDSSWFYGVKWLDSKITPGQYSNGKYINGDFVLTWWDYGHFITALSRSTVIADPLQADEEYIMRIARFFYNTTSEDEAMNWLMTQPWNVKDSGGYKVKYIILDFSLIGKAGALSFLGTNAYEYPNGYTASDGICPVGNICQNVENGLVAKKIDDKYTCAQGEVCTRDRLTNVDPKMCCEKDTKKCCNITLSGAEAQKKGGTAVLYRAPGTPVYGEYHLDTRNVICNRLYHTQVYETPQPIVENKTVKSLKQSFLYTGSSGMPFADGRYYDAFIILEYTDGRQDVKLMDVSESGCTIKDVKDVLGLGKDAIVDMGYSMRVANDVIRPQVYIHVPQRWMKNMFTELYINDAKNLKYFTLVKDSDALFKQLGDKRVYIYPDVKIYRITYPDEMPAIPSESSQSGPSQFTSPLTAEGAESEPEPTNSENTKNMTFDYFDQSLNEKYDMSGSSGLVWNCEVKRELNNSVIELADLERITCALNKAQPSEVCKPLGVSINDDGKISVTKATATLISSLVEISSSQSCAAGSTAKLQAFFSSDCSICGDQMKILNDLESTFAGGLKIEYYCTGNREYCQEHSLKIL